MPSGIRMFWWAGVAIATFWTIAIVSNAAEVTLSVQRVSSSPGNSVRVAQIVYALLAILAWGGTLLYAAWLAAFRRKGWARYLFVAIVVTNLSIPVIVALFYYGLNIPLPWLAKRTLLDPGFYLTALLLFVSMLFAFSESAQGWFRGGKQ